MTIQWLIVALNKAIITRDHEVHLFLWYSILTHHLSLPSKLTNLILRLSSVRSYFYIGWRWINIVDKTVPISAKKIINIIFYSFSSTIILDLFPSKQSLALAVGIIYNIETWKVRNYILYCSSTFTDVLGRLWQEKMISSL